MSEQWVTVNQIDKNPMYAHLRQSRGGYDLLAGQGWINVKNMKGGKAVRLDTLEVYVSMVEELNKNYFSLRKILEYFNFKRVSQGKTKDTMFEGMLSVAKEGYFDFRLFDQPIKGDHLYIKKDSFLRFMDSHVHLTEALERSQLMWQPFMDAMKKWNIKQVVIHHTLRFYSKDKLDEFYRWQEQDRIDREGMVTLQKIQYDPKYSYVKMSIFATKRLGELGWIEVRKTSDGLSLKLSDLEAYIQLQNELKDHYLTINELQEALRVSCSSESEEILKRNLEQLANQDLIEIRTFDKPIGLYDTFYSKRDVQQLIEQYVDGQTLAKKQGCSIPYIRSICKNFNIPFLDFTPRKILISPSCISALIKKMADERETKKEKEMSISNDVDVNVWLSIEEVGVLLNNPNWLKQINESDFKIMKINNKKYLKKENITNLIDQKNKWIQAYYTMTETDQLLKSIGSYLNLVKYARVEIPKFLRIWFKAQYFMYERSSIDAFVQERQKEMMRRTVLGETSFDTFLYRCDLDEISLHSPYTKEEWLKYVKQTLNASKGHTSTQDENINRFVQSTLALQELTKEKEIFNVTTNTINLTLGTLSIASQKYLYAFLRKIAESQKGKLEVKYQFDRLNDPYKLGLVGKEKEIYSFEQYKKLFDYAKDVVQHQYKAIQAARSTTSTKPLYYDSVWLYILIHLSNAWRHLDVVGFPRIQLEETKIESLDWLESNRVDEEDAKRIIQQVIRSDLKISKTQVRNHFYCADELVIPLATAAAVCELRTRTTAPKREYIIQFSDLRRNRPSTGMIKTFLQQGLDLKFESRKMNRTVMTFLYLLSIHKGRGGVALEIAQFFRGHQDFTATNFYLQIPEDELNILSVQLLNRDTFGYIPYLFNRLLSGQRLDREQETNRMIELRKQFGDVYKIEVTSGFLNIMLHDRQEVFDKVMTMTLEEINETLQRSYLGQLPSKEENIQCLHGDTGCIKPNLSCLDCPWSIPNFYALSSLAQGLTDLLIRFQTTFDQATLYAEKVRLANLLYRRLEVWREACNKYGIETVYSFITGGREWFIDTMSQIASVQEYVSLPERS